MKVRSALIRPACVFLLPTLLAHAAAAQPVPPPPDPPAAPTGQPAQPTGEPKPLSETLTGAARDDYEAGKELYGAENYEGALVKFQASHDESKDARLFWNIAACEKNLHHYAKALQYLQRYRDEGGALLTEQDKVDAEQLIKTMQALTSRVTFRVNEPGAEIFVDDVLVGRAPLKAPIVVDSGLRRIRVRKDEFTEFSSQIPVGSKPELTVEVKLDPIVHEGKLVVSARSGDTIFIDGNQVGTGHWTGTLKAGPHTIRVTAEGMKPYAADVVVQDDQTRNVNVALEALPQKKGVPLWVWIAGGTVVASGAAVGGYFLFRPDPEPGPFPTGNFPEQGSHVPVSFGY